MPSRIERLRTAIEALKAEGCEVTEQWALRIVNVDGSGHNDMPWGGRERAEAMAARHWAEIAKRGPEGWLVRPVLICRLVIATPAIETNERTR